MPNIANAKKHTDIINGLFSTSIGCEIVSCSIVNAPIDLVYRAWTDPNHLKNWWGPAGFTNTFNEFDFRVGGRWKFIMHGTEKENYENDCEFTTTEKSSLLAWKRYSKLLFNVIATFEEVSVGQTKIVFKQIFETPEECNKVKKFAVDKNEENFDRLKDELRKMADIKT